MIAYTISLKSKQVSTNWKHVCSLLERTLNSIYNQSDQDFKVVIVCHEKPKLELSYPNLIYYQVDFLPPKRTYDCMILDRDIKEIIGRKISQELKPHYIMAIDSDDCISAKISEFINNRVANCATIPDGFYADRGYIYYEETNKFVDKTGLYNCCGSTVALKPELYDTPDSWNYDALVEFKHNGRFFSHGDLVKYWQSKKKVIQPFPFKSCIYVRPNFEPSLDAMSNVWTASLRRRDLKLLLSPIKRKVTKFFNSQDIPESFPKEFGFHRINSPLHDHK